MNATNMFEEQGYTVLSDDDNAISLGKVDEDGTSNFLNFVKKTGELEKRRIRGAASSVVPLLEEEILAFAQLIVEGRRPEPEDRFNIAESLSEDKIRELSKSHKLRLVRMVKVSDDWYPCFPGGEIMLSITMSQWNGDPFVRISAWGNDDTGVEMDHYESGKYDGRYGYCYGVYKMWKRFIFDRVPDGVDMEWFFEHGFYWV